MASVVARRVASVPARTASETWRTIVDLLAPNPDHPDRDELEAVGGVASSSIASEATGDDAIVVYGGGVA